ncbi:MAG: anthranilate synthase component I family protein [Candidatus Krumholzibacteriia bacterium]
MTLPDAVFRDVLARQEDASRRGGSCSSTPARARDPRLARVPDLRPDTVRWFPDADAFARLHRVGVSIPVILEFVDPGWDPLHLVAALPAHETVYLLETPGAPADLERRTFMAWQPDCEVLLRGNHLESRGAAAPVLRQRGRHPLQMFRAFLVAEGALSVPYSDGFGGGFVGYVSYDFKNFLERLPDRVTDDLGTPELRLGFVRRVVSWDHRSGRVCLRVNLRCQSTRARCDRARALDALAALLDEVAGLARRAPRAEPGRVAAARAPLHSNLSRASYDRMLARAHDYILAGDIYQANLSHRFEVPFSGSGLELYRHLRAINPSPFAAYMRFPEHEVVSCSPERLVRLQRGRVETRPIAGTRPRGASGRNDRALERELLASEKERAEHLMIVDMARNDIGRVCELGSVQVESFMSVERYSHVRHLVSNVTGRLGTGRDGLHLLAATFPGASVTGVPKVRCMQIIDELESVRRGVYTGSAGYLGLDGNMDFNILIRTFFLQNGRAWFHVGGGIVADSDPDFEYQETLAKGRALREALLAVGGATPAPGRGGSHPQVIGERTGRATR